jgi:uncharacterized oligopeptide transporter (OPT) family protein
MIHKKKSRKGQIEFSLVAFIGILVMLIVVAPLLLKVVKTANQGVSNALGNVTGGAEGKQSMEHITNTFVSFWDWVIMICFLLSVVLLLLSAFLIDTHPAWIIVYILFGFLMFLLVPAIQDTMDKIYNTSQLATEVSSLPMTDFVRDNLWIICLGVFFISGIIIYAKIRLGGNSGSFG